MTSSTVGLLTAAIFFATACGAASPDGSTSAGANSASKPDGAHSVGAASASRPGAAPASEPSATAVTMAPADQPPQTQPPEKLPPTERDHRKEDDYSGCVVGIYLTAPKRAADGTVTVALSYPNYSANNYRVQLYGYWFPIKADHVDKLMAHHKAASRETWLKRAPGEKGWGVVTDPAAECPPRPTGKI